MRRAHDRTSGVGCQIFLSSGNWAAALVMLPLIALKVVWTSATSVGAACGAAAGAAGGCCPAATPTPITTTHASRVRVCLMSDSSSKGVLRSGCDRPGRRRRGDATFGHEATNHDTRDRPRGVHGLPFGPAVLLARIDTKNAASLSRPAATLCSLETVAANPREKKYAALIVADGDGGVEAWHQQTPFTLQEVYS